jgi:hypothetical protein
MSRYSVGLLLMLAGSPLIIVAFFSPWFDVFSNDPSWYVPRRGYSPWMVLQSGQPHSLGWVMWMFLLLILGMTLSSPALGLTHSASRRSLAAAIVRDLAVLCLVMIIIGVPDIASILASSQFGLSGIPTYGIVLAMAGFVTVLFGIATLSTYFPQWRNG